MPDIHPMILVGWAQTDPSGYDESDSFYRSQLVVICRINDKHALQGISGPFSCRVTGLEWLESQNYNRYSWCIAAILPVAIW
jgi:hypothetical protein